MVPFQTFLALLTLLMMLSSCSQKAPPSSLTSSANETPGTKEPLNKPNPNPNPVIKPTLPVGDASVELDSQWTLKLKGEEAQKIYELMVVAAEKSETGDTLFKRGQGFSCSKLESTKTFGCELHLAAILGEVQEQLPLASVKLASSEAAQKSELTETKSLQRFLNK